VFLNVNLRVFCHATEERSKVKQALEFLLPGGTLTESQTEGHHGNPIVIYEMKTGKRSDANKFWKGIRESVSREELVDGIEARIDKDCVLYLRLDKQKAYLGKTEMVKHEDVIAVSSKIESHPKKRETAIKNALEFFENSG